MWLKTLRTGPGWDGLTLRLALGVMIFPHGAQKVFGWFGGHGFNATMNNFTENMGIPFVFAGFAILAEFLGGLALIAGLATRLAALSVGATLVVAAVMFHWNNGFFMNWSGNNAGEGLEFFILTTGIALALMIRGGGNLSMDQWIQKRFGGTR